MRYRHMLVVAAMWAQPGLARDTWVIRVDQWGNPTYSTLTLDRTGGAIVGDLDGDRVEGVARGRIWRFKVITGRATGQRFDVMVDRGTMAGTADYPDAAQPAVRHVHRLRARRVPERPLGPPQVHDFVPQDYANAFDQHRAPVLTIWPGDTVRTTTIDSGGIDSAGKTVALFGNPQTGPFFVVGAVPGDTLKVTLKRIRPNRDTADSLDAIVGRAQSLGLARDVAGLGKPVRWTLDRRAGFATPEGASGALARLKVPLRPMLGGLAVAPGFGSQPLSSGDTGRSGGNMDFNAVIEGNIVYLPVQQPGALLYLGDGHAAQGDGETSQYALETSLDVQITVDLIKGKSIAGPRVESPMQIMVLGQAGSLDEATRAATSGMVAWLRADYAMSPAEAAQLMGAALRLDIANLAGRSVGVAARIDKALLPPPMAP